MLNAIIVDDEQESINALCLKLNECSIKVQIMETITDSRKVPDALKRHPIDILFLDVEMPGINGITLLENMGDRTFEVILVTAYDQYALKALKASALDYLMKPVDIEELQEALEKVSRKKSGSSPEKIEKKLDQLSTILQQVNSSLNQKLALSSVTETYYVSPSEIIYISGENNYSIFYLIDGRKITVSKTLKEYEELLSKEFFFRPHKSYIINLSHIKKLNKGLELSVSMINEDQIEISHRKKTDFLKIMKEITQ